jgi:VPDSG-CTERM motif
MKTSPALLVIALACFLAPVSSRATSMSWSPSPSNLGDLNHHSVYTWRIDNINVNPNLIKSVTLTFTSIRNWDGNPNILHLHLLDTAKRSGVRSFIDDPSGSAPVVDYTDDFISTRYHNQSNWLVAPGTSDTFLTNQSFTLTPVNWSFTLSASQLAAFRSYVANGHNVAFGLDPDCHFFNDGVKVTMNVPDTGSTCALLGLAMGLILFARCRLICAQARS